MSKGSNGNLLADSQLARLLGSSASQAWQVGTGVYARAGQEGARLRDTLAQLGGGLDQGAKSRLAGVRGSATEAWDRLESAVAQRVARALNALQIPTARDVHELSRRVEALQRSVVLLERRAAAMAKPGTGPGSRRAPRRAPAASRAAKRGATGPRAKARA